MSSVRIKVISSSKFLTELLTSGMNDTFSVIEIIEEDESEELIEAAELVNTFECNCLSDNMKATELAEEIEIESKPPRVSEEREGIEDTEI